MRINTALGRLVEGMSIAPSILAPHNAPRERLLHQIREASGGTVFAFSDGEPMGHVVSITNSITDEASTAADRAWALAEMLANLNPALTSDLVIGFWRDGKGRLFLDVRIVVAHAAVAHAVGIAFRQEAIAVLGSDKVRIEPARDWAGSSSEHVSPESDLRPALLILNEGRGCVG